MNAAPPILKGLSLLLVLVSASASVQASYAQGVVEGTVELPKVVPRPPARIRYSNQVIQPGPPEPPTAVVYLEGKFPPPSAAEKSQVLELAQKDLQFAVGLMPVRVGTKVSFPNRDESYHNVFSYSKPKRFDLGRYQSTESPPAQSFDQPGVIKLYCEIHEHMRATILVLETPYFAKTDTNGFFRLEGLPAGDYVLKAWLDEKTIREQPVKIAADSKLHVDFPAK